MHHISHSIKNVNVIELPLGDLCKPHICLKEELGRYDRQSNGPLKKDTLHLGLRLVAKTIKSSVVKCRSVNSGQQRAVSNRRNHRDGYQPSGRFLTLAL